MRLLVTGAGGMLGQDVVAAARAAGHEVLALARADLDVTSWADVDATFARERPEGVVNCAAWTDVDGAEAAEEDALLVNGAGAGHVAVAAAAVGARCVHVSTDYVFDGRAGRDLVESDAPAPLGAYGRTKLVGEQAVADAGGDAVVVRTSWLFGTGGRNFVETMLGLAGTRDEVTVVDDQVGCPTWTGHLAPALVALAAPGGPGGVLHVAGAGRCSWHGFASAIFAAAGATVRVAAGRTEDLGRPAPRPAWSALASERPDAPRLPAWEDGLAAYLAARKAGQPA